ncbi:MAG: M23 family metallopeptidase [Faecalibacillus sp.]
MSEIDEVKKRIERRKKPLTNYHFNKLYNGMIKMMVFMIVIIGSMIVINTPDIEDQILNNQLIKQFVSFVSDTVYSFIPGDSQVSQTIEYQNTKDNYYTGDSNQILAFAQGKVIQVKNDDDLLGNYLVVLDENEVEITYSHLEKIQVKQFQEVKKDTVLATYNKQFQMTFEYLGKDITYQEYQGM